MAKIPLATYRLQFHPGFTLRDAAALADYLSDLGVSHLYASPYLQAAPRSLHGYDVVDPGRVNEELGGSRGHRELCSALQKHGLGLVLDVVPNHMAITGPENAWWWDVLEHGPLSFYAAYFDVDWNPPEERLGNRILLPILGDHYGRVLEAGEIRLLHERGRFTIHCHDDHSLPVSTASLAGVLERAAGSADFEELAFIADFMVHLCPPEAHGVEDTRRRRRNWVFLQDLLAQALEKGPALSAAVNEAVEEVNASPDLLDAFLEKQHYRLAFWRAAERDLGYRRFFDINTLIGMRVEDENVFADTHRLILQWLRDGTLDGVRIDHPDGLRDPEQYLKRLRKAAPEAWIVVEKILHPGERLSSTWPVAGTTGYDFLNLLNGLFIDPSGEKPLTDFYAAFTGEQTDYPAIAREKKHQVLHELLASDVNRLTELLVGICERHRRHRDYTRWEINEAIREMIACFPVYRSYMSNRDERPGKEDLQRIDQVVSAAKTLRPELDPELFDFIKGLLLLEHPGDLEFEWAMRFQQLTGPAAAKGIEDTAFYSFNRLIGLNEVGGDPSTFGVSVEAFHRAMAQAANRSPHAMLSTSTHDTKHSEDMRARLALLSEMPDSWAEAVQRWSARNERHRRSDVPDRNVEYLFYQTLVGAWPIDKERVLPFMEKAIREAKVHTSWTQTDPEYEKAVLHFSEAVLDDPEFRSDLEAFVSSLVLPGRIHSLSEVLIKLTAPGVPDFYQGTELWDLSLVDPDNRRPVDFDLRRRLLMELKDLSPEQVLARTDEGVPKLWVIHKALELRKGLPDVFLFGNYQPMPATGRKADHVVAFLRGGKVMTVVPRLSLTLGREWEDTWIDLHEGSWRNSLTGEWIEGGTRTIREILERFPVGLWVREDQGHG